MALADEIRDRIGSTISFKEIISLREKVWSLSGSLSMREFLELRDRVERKMREFDDPVFDELTVVVKCRDAPDEKIEQDELREVLGKGRKLSEYVFTKCPEVLDYELHYFGLSESEEKVNIMAQEFGSDTASSLESRVGSIKDKVRRILSLALRLIVNLFNTYSKVFPHISEDLKMIREKIELLLESISTAYY